MPTISQVLTATQTQLNHLDEASTISRLLVAHALKLSQQQLWTTPHQEVTQEQLDLLASLTQRAARHEPLAYLLGYKEFYGRRFTVTPDTLIPRPESEQLITLSLNYAHQHHLTTPVIIDVGTGSGCLAITLALEIPQAKVYAVDTSQTALTIAQTNAATLGASVTFVHGSLLHPFLNHPTTDHPSSNHPTSDRPSPKSPSNSSSKSPSILPSKLPSKLPPTPSSTPPFSVIAPSLSANIIIANLPYISHSEYNNLPPQIKDFEPSSALISGPDPDTLNHQLSQQAPHLLAPQGLFAYETTNGRIITPNLSQQP